MDTCRGEVLPYPPDVLKGLKAFKIGMSIAFGMASLSYVAISSIRKDGWTDKDRRESSNVLSMASSFLSLAVHLVPFGFIIFLERNGIHWDSFSLNDRRIQMWEESVTLISLSLIILARSASTNLVTVFSFGCFISLLSVLHTTVDVHAGSAIFLLSVVGLCVLTVVLLKKNKHISAEGYAYVQYAEYKSGVSVLRGVFVMLAAFQLTLRYLQASSVLDTEIVALCGALLTCGAKFVFSVVCHDSSAELLLELSECKYMLDNRRMGSEQEGSVEGEEEMDEAEEGSVDNAEEEVAEVAAPTITSFSTTVSSTAPPQRRHSTPYPLQSSHHLHVAFSPSPLAVPSLQLAVEGKEVEPVAAAQNEESDRLTPNTQTALNTMHNAHPANNTTTHIASHSDSATPLGAAFRRSGSSGLTDSSSEASSRRQLLRYVFHEMRAPLNSISMAVDLLTHHSKRGTPKSKFLDLETLQIIEEATLTMERTLKDTMTLQKIEEGSLVAQLRIFSLYNMCDDIQDALKQVLRSNSVTLNCEIDRSVPDQIVGDHFRIRHVVAHVLSNAIKFSRVGGVVNLKVQVRSGVNSACVVSTGTPSAASGDASSGVIVSSCSAAGSFGVSNSTSLGFHSSSTDIGDLNLLPLAQYDIFPSQRGSLDIDMHHEPALRDIVNGVAVTGSAASESNVGAAADVKDPPSRSSSNNSNISSDSSSHSSHDTSNISEFIVISITDNGVGMSHELQESDIFKPFNQLKTETLTGFRGTGLGLAICKKIITFLQGSITYSSVPGVGTVFRITFPLTLLDTSSMDQVEEEDLPAIERALSEDINDANMRHAQNNAYNTAVPGLMVLGSPHTARHKAIARAKSFRGEKLLSILHNQSNVFDCPTPMSLSHVHSTSRLSSGDEADRGGSGGADSGQGSVGGGNGGISYAGSASVSPAPYIEDTSGQNILSSPAHRRTNTTTPPGSAQRLKAFSPPRHPSARTLPGTQGPHNSHNNSCSKILPGALSIDINRPASAAFSTNNSTPSSESTLHELRAHHYSSHPSMHNVFHSHDHSPTFHSLHSLLPSPIAAGVSKSASSDYSALTEKNVNLHILRTAASDGVRALKQTHHPAGASRKVSSKEALLEMLQDSKVLVVDDAPSNRKLLSMMLKRAGFGIIDLVEDGQAAVDYCRALSEADQPRIIFMDNTMPRLTGIEASKVIRQGGYPHLIIGVTGNSLEEELDEFIASGADLVIVKPLKNQSLELLLGFIQVNGFDSSHGFRIDMVGKEYTWVPRY